MLLILDSSQLVIILSTLCCCQNIWVNANVIIKQSDITNNSTTLTISVISREKLVKIRSSATVSLEGLEIEQIDNILFNQSEYTLLRNFELIKSIKYTFPENTSFLIHKHIVSVEIMSTGIDKIYVETFAQLPALNRVNLKDNLIVKLEANIFQNNPSLFQLNVVSNNISTIDTNIFLNLSNFTNFTLDDNDTFNFTQNKVFLKSNSLQKFSCIFCGITNIGKETFSMMPNLLWLNLEGSAISIIHNDGLKSLPKLRDINLKNNKLQTISPGHFNNLNELKKLNLNGNPFVPSLEMNAMKSWYSSKQFRKIEDSKSFLDELKSYTTPLLTPASDTPGTTSTTTPSTTPIIMPIITPTNTPATTPTTTPATTPIIMPIITPTNTPATTPTTTPATTPIITPTTMPKTTPTTTPTFSGAIISVYLVIMVIIQLIITVLLILWIFRLSSGHKEQDAIDLSLTVLNDCDIYKID